MMGNVPACQAAAAHWLLHAVEIHEAWMILLGDQTAGIDLSLVRVGRVMFGNLQMCSTDMHGSRNITDVTSSTV